ncbi:MAG TPA: ThiF family adenylyltransferase [Steroidobacteraceae bacterium]|jgi:molybdopterin/thiamine biosynthesis adenylyltransferase/molybdopterin synthase catalytic subunit/rhodanese-related sulfurtransferase|nr:ThiF family adenylyltransferase [Steroidobacteraceae bacterium]
MNTFRFSHEPLDTAALREALRDPACGGYTSFEGWVRNHNEGHNVTRLEYEAFEPLAVKEAERIMAEAVERFGIEHAACVHRLGSLAIGDMAVWVGASARHRHEAFLACRYIIDEVKHRVPIWKKEHYENGDSGWVNCERCAAPSAHEHEDARAHGHEHGHAHAHEHSAAGRARQAAPNVTPDYSRQMALKEVGPAGQAKLRASKVLVIGCGGLGVPVLTYLAGAGVGRIGLVDADKLEPSNLHRQTLYALHDVGEYKAVLAAERLKALNPEVDARAYTVRLTAENASDLVAEHDLVIDCTDNFSTKFLLNDVCVRLRKPVIFSSVYQYEGQLQIVRPDRGGACLRCVWPEATRDGLVGNCSEAGVLGPVPGVFGCLQALEALKTLLDLPGQLGDELLVLDLLTLSTSRVRIRRSPSCPDHASNRVTRAAPVTVADLEVAYESLDDAAANGLQVIDIREAKELVEMPTPASNARHIPMAELLHGNANLAPAGKYLLVCASGRRSYAAAEELRSRGFANVYSLRGGVIGLARRSVT